MLPLAEEQLCHELVVGLVGQERVFQVVVNDASRLRAPFVGADAKRLGELHGPELGELRTSQQAVDQLCTLGRIFRTEELDCFGLRWQQANRIEINAAQKVLVARQRRRA